MNRIATRNTVTKATELLVLEYLLKGGEITVAKVGRKVKTFPMVRGSVAHKGAKAINLKNVGIYLR
jgi:hypothetical protein